VVSRVSKLTLTAPFFSEFACFGTLPALPFGKISSLHVLTRAQRTRVHFCPQHWLLCHFFKIWVCISSSSAINKHAYISTISVCRDSPDTNEARGLQKRWSSVGVSARALKVCSYQPFLRVVRAQAPLSIGNFYRLCCFFVSAAWLIH
jgi:hypothetical protein